MSDDEDDYVAFGKPLRELSEKDIIRKKPIAVEEQIVRDVNGIRRFHGAFTGGWSAGHFNTVNTPQGWVPQQFKSSRETKQERATQRAEDFMDDEDRGAFGFAAEAVKTKTGFQGGEEPAVPGGRGGGVPGAALEQLVQPVLGTVGEALLTRQGWKPGQGIGPKVTRRNKAAARRSQARTFGCSLPGRQEEEEKDDPMLEKYKDFLFAPDEIPVAVAHPKDNFFGVGYSGMVRGTGAPGVHGIGSDFQVATSVSSGRSNRAAGGAMKKFSISGEAFGVGADEEDDDMAVYSHGTMAEYDFSLDVTDRPERREKAPRTKESSRWGAPTAASEEANFLEGFQAARAPSQLKKSYPLPEVPHGWRPRGRPGQRKSRFEPVAEAEARGVQASPRAQAARPGGSNPTVDQRKAVLFPDQANREPPKPEQAVVLPEFLQDDTKADGAFQPFARNPEKQKRYEQYRRCIDHDMPEVLHTLQPRTMTEWEKEREKVEFERASMLFQPMKGVIGSRFVSAGDSETVDKGEGKELGPEAGHGAKEAAALKLFGALTRTKEEWHPARLLCVRFNVAHPYSDHSVTGVPKPGKRETGVTNVFAALENVIEGGENVEKAEVDGEVTGDATAAVKAEEEEEVVVPKPPMDLFKAIFADSDSETSENEAEEANGEKEKDVLTKMAAMPAAADKPWEEKQGNVLRSSEPAKGIFANIDFEALNKRPAAKRPRSSSNSPPAQQRHKPRIDLSDFKMPGAAPEEDGGSSSDDTFGPCLPPGRQAVTESITILSDSEDGYKEKKSKKKKRKSKKHKKKSDGVEIEKEVIMLSSADSEDELLEKLKEAKKKAKKAKKHKRHS